MRLPTGRQIHAGRVLAGLDQRQLAKAAGIDPTTVGRMENSGPDTARGFARNVELVLKALERHGVEITEDGVRYVSRKGR
jgi:transcriptional regulator with XRE-family HTH domain